MIEQVLCVGDVRNKGVWAISKLTVQIIVLKLAIAFYAENTVLLRNRLGAVDNINICMAYVIPVYCLSQLVSHRQKRITLPIRFEPGYY